MAGGGERISESTLTDVHGIINEKIASTIKHADGKRIEEGANVITESHIMEANRGCRKI